MRTITVREISLIALMLLLGGSTALAGVWAPATGVPPSGNADAPLSVGSYGQIKTGGLTVNTSGADYGLLVPFGKIGIGTTTPRYKLDIVGDANISGSVCLANVCKSAWPTAGYYYVTKPLAKGSQLTSTKWRWEATLACTGSSDTLLGGGFIPSVAGYGSTGTAADPDLSLVTFSGPSTVAQAAGTSAVTSLPDSEVWKCSTSGRTNAQGDPKISCYIICTK